MLLSTQYNTHSIPDIAKDDSQISEEDTAEQTQNDNIDSRFYNIHICNNSYSTLEITQFALHM